jgi:hypothetical protein
MKTKIIFMIGFVLVCNISRAQTWNEWFRQKKTQKKYLIQQIAALKVYLNYLKKGYGIVQKGMKVVGDIKEGNFKSHDEYFTSLRSVNEIVSSSGKVSATIYYENLTIETIKHIIKDLEGTHVLTIEEREYVRSVGNNLFYLSERNVDEVKNLITANELEMKDDERLSRLLVLYEDAKDRFSFSRKFYNDNRVLILQREKELREVNELSQTIGL